MGLSDEAPLPSEAPQPVAHDPFNGLPAELRIAILTNIPDIPSLLNATHASQGLFRARRTSSFWWPIMRSHYHWCTNKLVRDAQAIITFPRFRRGTPLVERSRRIDAHLKRWARNELQDPFAGDMAAMSAVINFFSKLTMFAEDYMAKAVGPEPLAESYYSLPDWAHRSFGHHAGFPQIVIHKFDLKHLTRNESHRLLTAFIRYELLCKVYSPGQAVENDEVSDWITDVDGSLHGEGTSSGATKSSPDMRRIAKLVKWNWLLLEEYSPEGMDLYDLHRLFCIREYILTCYGALRRDLGDYPMFFGFVPVGDEALDQARFELTDAESPGRELCTVEPDLRTRSHDWIDPLSSLLASCGLDVLYSIFMSGRLRFWTFLGDFIAEARTRLHVCTLKEHASECHGDIGTDAWIYACVHMQRQGAFAFFDDDRYFLGDERYEWPLMEPPFVKSHLHLNRMWRHFEEPTRLPNTSITQDQRIVHGTVPFESMASFVRPLWARRDEPSPYWETCAQKVGPQMLSQWNLLLLMEAEERRLGDEG